MKIGPYSIQALETGRFSLDGGAMFGIVPRPLWSRRIEPDERGRIPLATRCLLIEGDGRLVVVDTGIGDKVDDRFRDIYGMSDTRGVEKAVEEAGFSALDVTDVILTHLHFDHCGGTTRRDGDRLVPVFPRAAHWLQADHWNWAHAGNPREKASFLPENYAPIEELGLLKRISGDQEILPGIRVQRVDGHTEAQQLVHVVDGSQHVVYVADLLPTSAHLAAAWGMAYDIRPLVTIEEKQALVRAAVDGKWRLIFEHDASVESTCIADSERGPVAVEAARLAEL